MADSLPLVYNLTAYTGVTFRRQFRWKPDGTTPQVFTGWSGSMRIGPQHGDAEKTLTPANGGLTLGATDGLITLYISAASTYDFVGDNLFYVLDLSPAPGTDPIRFLRGRFMVVRDLAKP
jgi:hypothetical protein